VQGMEIFELDLCRQVHGVIFCDRCGIIMKELEELQLGTLFTI
jgi:hypothetical protein